jgi:hypothetical protein
MKNLNGIVRVDLTKLNPDGSDVATPETYSIDTAKTASYEPEIQEGEEIEQTVNGLRVVALKRPDLLNAVNFTFSNAKFGAELFEIIAGQGTLIYDEVETDKVIGYEAPTTEQQRNTAKTPFKLDVFVARYADGENTKEQVIGYTQFTLAYCQGNFPNFSFDEGEFATPEFEVRATENKVKGAGVLKFVDIDSLPA